MKGNGHFQDINNVLQNLSFNDAEELSAKVVLKFNELIDQRWLSQVGPAAITGMTQPVSQVCRYKLQNISLERMMQALVSLD